MKVLVFILAAVICFSCNNSSDLNIQSDKKTEPKQIVSNPKTSSVNEYLDSLHEATLKEYFSRATSRKESIKKIKSLINKKTLYKTDDGDCFLSFNGGYIEDKKHNTLIRIICSMEKSVLNYKGDYSDSHNEIFEVNYYNLKSKSPTMYLKMDPKTGDVLELGYYNEKQLPMMFRMESYCISSAYVDKPYITEGDALFEWRDDFMTAKKLEKHGALGFYTRGERYLKNIMEMISV